MMRVSTSEKFQLPLDPIMISDSYRCASPTPEKHVINPSLVNSLDRGAILVHCRVELATPRILEPLDSQGRGLLKAGSPMLEDWSESIVRRGILGDDEPHQCGTR